MKPWEEFLYEYKDHADVFLHGEGKVAKEYYDFFQDFFRRENLEQLTWERLQTLGDHVHAFNSFPLAKKKALGKPNHSMEHYRKSLAYLAHGLDPELTRIENFRWNPDYKIKNFGRSAVSEIAGYVFADKFIFMNSRDEDALKRFGIMPKESLKDPYSERLARFTAAAQPVVDDYLRIVGRRTELPLYLEVDQFFSWLYKTHPSSAPQTFKLSKEQISRLWTRFHNRIGGFVDFERPGEDFEQTETAYKHALFDGFEKHMGRAKIQKLLEKGNGDEALKEIARLLGGNLVHHLNWQNTFGRLKEECNLTLDAILEVTAEGYDGPDSLAPIFEAFEEAGKTPDWDALSMLLWALRRDDYVHIKISYIRSLASELGWALPGGRPTAESFDSVLSFVNAIKKAIKPQKPRDSVDVHSFIWVVCPDTFPDRRQTEGGVEVVPAGYMEADALRELFMDADTLRSILNLLRYKRNVILQGPPGVGKTYLARRLAYLLNGEQATSCVQTVQFHQSYSYEDFIQGYRPNGSGGFDRRDGILLTFCRRALAAPDQQFVFVIDEINRGNLSRIFGELLMLIEPDKRGAEFAIPLTYSRDDSESFFVPTNVYFIGTMNTADRSLAFVDFALRRRFAFVDLLPAFDSPKYKNSLRENGVSEELFTIIRAKLNHINSAISADSRNLGPGFQIGHSYFCPRDGMPADRAWYRTVIQAEVAPLLREYWFDDSAKVDGLINDLLAD